jgi:hypothetical protein
MKTATRIPATMNANSRMKKNTSAATEGWGRSGIGGGNQLILDGHPACF